MRVLAFDAGMNFGWAALGGGKEPAAGSRRLNGGSAAMGVCARHADSTIRQLILQERPTILAFATPFVGVLAPREIMVGGQKKFTRFAAVPPQALRVLMGLTTVVEMIADELKIRCIELAESDARKALLGTVPRKSADIKEAIVRAFKQMGYPCCDHHAGDALCVASFALDCLAPTPAHERTPLFIAARPAPKRRGKK